MLLLVAGFAYIYMKSLVTKRDKGQSEKNYPCENIDDRQENTIPLPFVCKMRYIKRVHRIFENKWKRDCLFLSIVDVFAGVTQFFHFGFYRVL